MPIELAYAVGLGAAAIIAGLVIFCLIPGEIDKYRIRKHLQDQGLTVLSFEEHDLETGWIEAGTAARFWEVTFKTSGGDIRKRICRIGLLSGIYWKD